MARLKNEVKIFIVRALAVFNTPQEVANLVNAEFGIKIDRRNCEKYDPTKSAGQDLSEDLKNEFEKTRKLYQSNPQSIPISNLTVRMQRYEDIWQGTKSPVIKLKTLRQSAEDIGGMFENKQSKQEPEPVDNEININIVRVGRKIEQAE